MEPKDLIQLIEETIAHDQPGFPPPRPTPLEQALMELCRPPFITSRSEQK